MRSLRPLTVALAGWCWSTLAFGAFLYALFALGPILDRLPRVLDTGLPLVAMGALMVYVPPAFPFWRGRLTVDDRRRLFAGSGGGSAIGGIFGAIAGLAVLEADFVGIQQSTRSMTVLWCCLVVSGVAGAYLTARNLSPFAPATAPRLDGPIESDGIA
jgi:hypothetical protein